MHMKLHARINTQTSHVQHDANSNDGRSMPTSLSGQHRAAQDVPIQLGSGPDVGYCRLQCETLPFIQLHLFVWFDSLARFVQAQRKREAPECSLKELPKP
jgi:hypothetical protein